MVGCANTIDVSQEFDEREFAWSTQSGTARIHGQAFLKTMAGDVKYCAGEEIRLWPHARYTAALWAAADSGQRVKNEHPQAVQKYIRRTTGDGVGGFDFSNLPAGKYYVACRLVWVAGTGIYAQETGGYATAIVEVAAGETKRVIATSR